MTEMGGGWHALCFAGRRSLLAADPIMPDGAMSCRKTAFSVQEGSKDCPRMKGLPSPRHLELLLIV